MATATNELLITGVNIHSRPTGAGGKQIPPIGNYSSRVPTFAPRLEDSVPVGV